MAKLPDDVILQTVQFWGDLLRERKPNFGPDSDLIVALQATELFDKKMRERFIQRAQFVVEDEAQITVFENTLAAWLLDERVGYPDWAYSLDIDYSDSEGNSPALLAACEAAGIDVRCLPWKTSSYSSVHGVIWVRVRNGDREALENDPL